MKKRKINIVENTLLFLFMIAVFGAIATFKAVFMGINIIICAVFFMLLIIKYIKGKYTFIFVVIIIVLIPVLTKSKLLIFGERTYGELITHKKVYSEGLTFGSGFSYYAVIQFKTKDATFEIWGAENIIYKTDDKISIAYDKNNPLNCMILEFSYVYFGTSVILSLFLLIVWIPLYFTLKGQVFKKRGFNINKPTAGAGLQPMPVFKRRRKHRHRLAPAKGIF
jgi:hypothetical protein